LEWAIIADVAPHEKGSDSLLLPAIDLMQRDEIVVRGLRGERVPIDKQLEARQQHE